MYTANEKRYDEMRYNRCGRSGLMLSAFSLGMWHIVTTAFDLGITHIDLANNYGPEPGTPRKILARC